MTDTGFVSLPATPRAAGARLFYRLDGRDGAPVVTMLHSLATHGGLWERESATLVQAGYRVLRPDMRGHGRSMGGGDDFDLALLAQDVVALWDALGIATSRLLGLSIGGMIALHLALDHASRVDAVIAADCRSDAPPFFVEMWEARRAIVTAHGIKGVVDPTLATWLTADCDAKIVAKVGAMIQDTSAEGYFGATRALQRLALFHRLGDLSLPVRYIVGAQDGVHPDAMRAMAAATPGAALVEIPGASHLANIDQPALFADAVLNFFGRERGRQAS